MFRKGIESYIEKDSRGCRRLEMVTATRFQTLDEAVCISYSANTFGKNMNPTIFSPVMDK